MYSLIGTNPHFVVGYIEARLGIAGENGVSGSYLAALHARGYGTAEVMDLYRAFGMIVVGAAVARAHRRYVMAVQGTD